MHVSSDEVFCRLQSSAMYNSKAFSNICRICAWKKRVTSQLLMPAPVINFVEADS